METNKICPICESEYFPEVQMCPDCNVALQWAKPSVDPRKPDPEVWERLQPGDVLGQVTRDGNEVVEAYLGHLQAAGIEAGVLPLTRYQQAGEFDEDLHRVFGVWFTKGSAGQVPVVDGRNGVPQLLFVARDNWERANGIIDEIFAELHPDAPDGYYQEFDSNTCPACGNGVLEEWEECPGCGLSF